MNIGHGVDVGLTSVEITRHIVGRRVLIVESGQDCGHEAGDSRSELFLVDHVEAGDKVGVLGLTNSDIFEDLLEMLLAQDLVTGEDQT